MSNEVAVKENTVQKVETKTSLKSLLNSPAIKAKFEEMLGNRTSSFLSSIISAVSTNKQLGACEPMSVITAAAIAASVNLPINSSLGFAHIVPYKGIAQFQMGWKGFVQLALRSGQYQTINLSPVYTGQIRNHNPFTGTMEFSAEPVTDFTFGNQIGYLLYFKLMNGYEKYFFMTKQECEHHGKKYSQSFKKGYGLWVDNFEAMALKTVAKLGLSKYGILSVEMQTAIELDQVIANEKGDHVYIDNPPEDDKPKVSSLNDKLKNKEVDPPEIDLTEKIDDKAKV